MSCTIEKTNICVGERLGRSQVLSRTRVMPAAGMEAQLSELVSVSGMEDREMIVNEKQLLTAVCLHVKS